MNTFKPIKCLIVALMLMASINSNAIDFFQLFTEGHYKVDFTPVQIGVIGNLFATDNVYGLAFALPISSNNNSYGLTTGVWGKSKNHSGIQLNAVNLAHELDGLQIGLVGMIGEMEGIGSEASGIQMNLFYNASETFFGLQSGLVNQSGRMNGAQLGFINVADQGLQFGVVNVFNSPRTLELDPYQSDAHVQVGLYNHSNHSSFQFGVLNYNRSSLIPIFPIFNFSTD